MEIHIICLLHKLQSRLEVGWSLVCWIFLHTEVLSHSAIRYGDATQHAVALNSYWPDQNINFGYTSLCIHIVQCLTTYYQTHDTWLRSVAAYERQGSGFGGAQSARFGTVGGKSESSLKPGEKTGKKKWEVVISYSGPCVLPWLWQDLKEDGEIMLSPQPIAFRAGPEGNIFSVCQLSASHTFRFRFKHKKWEENYMREERRRKRPRKTSWGQLSINTSAKLFLVYNPISLFVKVIEFKCKGCCNFWWSHHRLGFRRSLCGVWWFEFTAAY